jgi:hypothetical protein
MIQGWDIMTLLYCIHLPPTNVSLLSRKVYAHSPAAATTDSSKVSICVTLRWATDDIPRAVHLRTPDASCPTTDPGSDFL